MISKALVKQIEVHSSRLTQEVLAAIRNDARTEAYRNLDDSHLREAIEELFRHLGLWLSGRTNYAVESRYRRIGRERCQQGIPLSQVIHGFSLVRKTLLDFLRNAALGHPAEAQLEHELALAVCDFAERAVYYATLGYEDALRASQQVMEQRAAKQEGAEVESMAAPPLPPRQPWDPAADWDVNISRGGDIGEVSG